MQVGPGFVESVWLAAWGAVERLCESFGETGAEAARDGGRNETWRIVVDPMVTAAAASRLEGQPVSIEVPSSPDVLGFATEVTDELAFVGPWLEICQERQRHE